MHTENFWLSIRIWQMPTPQNITSKFLSQYLRIPRERLFFIYICSHLYVLGCTMKTSDSILVGDKSWHPKLLRQNNWGNIYISQERSSFTYTFSHFYVVYKWLKKMKGIYIAEKIHTCLSWCVSIVNAEIYNPGMPVSTVHL